MSDLERQFYSKIELRKTNIFLIIKGWVCLCLCQSSESIIKQIFNNNFTSQGNYIITTKKVIKKELHHILCKHCIA